MALIQQRILVLLSALMVIFSSDAKKDLNDANPCQWGAPLPNVYCGRSLEPQQCPDGYECIIHPADVYAVCCRTNKPLGDCPQRCFEEVTTAACGEVNHGFYYDAATDSCEEFSTGICGQGGGSFETQSQCRSCCKGKGKKTP